jgi:hypothetical protein
VQELGASAGNTFGLTVAPDGTEMLTYAVGPGDVYAAVAPPGGSFAGQHLFAPGLSSLQGVDSAIGATGDGVVAWRYQSQNGTGPYVSDAAGYDASPPVLNKLTVPSSGTVGDLLSFSVEPFDIWGPVTTSWAFGDGATGDGRSVTHSYSTAGDMTAAVTATDSVGNATTASRPVSIANPPVTNQQQSPVVSQSPAPAVDTTKPVVTGFAAVPSAFAVGKKGTALAAKVHRGTTFRFRLSEPASVAIAIARQIPGLRKGASCVPATAKLTAAILRKSGKRGLARARCKAFKQVGTLTRTGTAGDNTVAFTGKLGRRALGVGRYRATLVATDAARNSSLPAVASFRIVPAR